MIKLLAVDMDGTCLDPKSRMTDATLGALSLAAKAGIRVVPTTGRTLGCLPHRLVGRSDIFRYVITSNGAKVTDLQTKRTVFRADIKKESALSLLEEVKNTKGLHVGITSHVHHEYLLQGQILVLLGRVIYGKDARQVRRVTDMMKEIAGTQHGIEEIQFYFLGKNAREMTKGILARYADLSAAYTDQYVEIFSKQASKGTALCALAQELGIERSEIACIGDGENDLTMFRAAGMKMAMGNAVEELKRAADIVLPSNEKDGAAEGILRCVNDR